MCWALSKYFFRTVIIITYFLFKIVFLISRRGKPPIWTPDNKKLAIHPKSVLSNEKYFRSNILVYYRKVKSTSDYIHDASLIHPLPVIFFGDHFTQVEENGHNMIVINKNKLKFQCTESTGNIIKDLRDRFEWFLEHKISHPGPVLWSSENDEIRILE